MAEKAKEVDRHQFEVLRAQLDYERSSFYSHWRDLNDYISPRRARFFVSDRNKGDRRNQKIIDSTATLACRTLQSGMMSGITSPARAWFRLMTPDPALNEVEAVKDWLYIVSQRMSTVFSKSNLYNCLPIVYGDMGRFGTGAMLIEEDFDSVVRFYPFPIGSYYIANDDRLKVNTFFREFPMTVQQIVEKFGRDPVTGEEYWDNISPMVKQLYDFGQCEAWVEVCHIIKPNENYDPKKMHSKFKKYRSVYYERGSSSANANYLNSEVGYDRLLSDKGYDFFPVLCPRWDVTGEDVYGTDCPGMTALGDIKQLQLGEKRIAQAIEKMINPPMVGPPSLRNQKSTILPGDITYLDEPGNFKAAHQVQLDVSHLEQKQQQIRDRIRRCFFEDLFLMLAESDRRQITAREIDERHEEKLLALGPVLEQLDQDLLNPLIEITFSIMMRYNDANGQNGLIPPPPKEIQGQQLKVEYLSIMAQAQKLLGIGSIERFFSFSAQVIQSHPEAADKIDVDHSLEVYGEMTSLPPGIIRSDDQVSQIRQQRAQQQQQQQQMEQLQQGAGVAKDLSQANTSGQNALAQLLDQGKAGSMVPQ